MLRLLFSFLLLGPGLLAGEGLDVKKKSAEVTLNILLKQGVTNGLVDYALFKKNTESIDAYIEFLKAKLSADQKSKKAYVDWINLYNVLTLKLIADQYPHLKSIKDLKKPWDSPVVTINKKSFTLNDIEHKTLRAWFDDYRVHFVLVCASLGCPDLRTSLYTYDNIEAELEYETKKYLNSSKGTKLKGDKLLISRLFKWYGDDFTPDIKSVLKTYLTDSKKIKALKNSPGLFGYSHLSYSWDLNDLKK